METAGGDDFVVRYDELALKGRNRTWFVKALVRNLRDLTAGLGVAEVRPFKGRIEVRLGATADGGSVAERLRHAFGIANFSRAHRCAPDLESILEAAVAVTEGVEAAPFRVRARRSDKRFPVGSPEIERLVGAHLHARRGWPVDLRHPQRTVLVEVAPGAAYCSADREPGPGGLPVDTGGRVLCLLSGGADSPVAAWRVMHRGCRADLVHFHSHPISSDRSQAIVRHQAARLARFQGALQLAMVPLAGVQRHVAASAPASLRVVLYRRFMVRIAGQLAGRHDARALVTGDAIGQVASQTVENLVLVDDAVGLPVLRPLIGSDKREILAWAARIGTGSTRVDPGDDCCSIYSPRRAATRGELRAVQQAEGHLDVDGLVLAAVEAATWEAVLPEWS
jgi:thiamine biosynthesis protein ThiI